MEIKESGNFIRMKGEVMGISRGVSQIVRAHSLIYILISQPYFHIFPLKKGKDGNGCGA